MKLFTNIFIHTCEQKGIAFCLQIEYLNINMVYEMFNSRNLRICMYFFNILLRLPNMPRRFKSLFVSVNILFIQHFNFYPGKSLMNIIKFFCPGPGKINNSPCFGMEPVVCFNYDRFAVF